jgi:two-component system CheB/CheR fusion protein
MVDRLNSNILRMNVLAYTDAVTKLPNRSVVFHLLEKLSQQDQDKSAAILFIDLDGFKRISDQLGHEVGDTVLREASHRIASGLGRELDELETCTTPLGELCDTVPNDIVLARVAGDEFVAIVPDLADAASIEALCRDILKKLARALPIADANLRISASIGVASFPEDGNTPEALLNVADLAMYEAKRSGRSKAILASPSLRAEWQQRRDVESDMPSALQNGDIKLHYQPRCDARTMALVSAEGLARWHHDTLGDISPAVFVPLAEHAGLVPLLGAKMFEYAAQSLGDWKTHGFDLDISVNVSAAEFNDANLADRMLRVLAQHGVSPQRVELEITESMAMSDFEETHDQMLRLCEAGFRIAVDDFGTGYSNFSQLARLPFSSIKLDQSLVAPVATDERARSVVCGIMKMANDLGLKTVAEGVESPAQIDVMRELGCDELQGFGIARPMQRDELLGFRAVGQKAIAERPRLAG